MFVRIPNFIQHMSRWSGDDRKRLEAWIAGNHYRAAYLIHTVPIKPNTLERILKGYHDPGALMTARLRDILERFPRGERLPHPESLVS